VTIRVALGWMTFPPLCLPAYQRKHARFDRYRRAAYAWSRALRGAPRDVRRLLERALYAVWHESDWGVQ
jgi:hypothetical protein